MNLSFVQGIVLFSQGQRVFDELLLAGTKRKLTVKIAQSQPSKSQPSTDTEVLEQEKAAEVSTHAFFNCMIT